MNEESVVMKEEDIRDIKHLDKIAKMRTKDIKKFLRVSKFVEVDCPACSSAKYTSVFQKEKFRFVKCYNCRTVFVNPRPIERDIKAYYTKAKSCKEFANMVKRKEERRKELIYIPRAKFVISKIEKYLARIENISILEIGAGTGGFLEILKEKKPDWHFMAIEPEKISGRFLKERGFEVISDIVEKVDRAQLPAINVILNFELIEHIFDSHKFIKKVYDILQPGGILALSTPNYNGFDFLAIGKNYKNIDAPNHLNYFNAESIRVLLKKAGFNILDIVTRGGLDIDLVKNFYGKSKKTGNRFLDFLLYETNDSLLRKFQKFLQDNRLSGHMLVVAKKT